MQSNKRILFIQAIFFPLKTICLYFIINIYYNAIRVTVTGFVTLYEDLKVIILL